MLAIKNFENSNFAASDHTLTNSEAFTTFCILIFISVDNKQINTTIYLYFLGRKFKRGYI